MTIWCPGLGILFSMLCCCIIARCLPLQSWLTPVLGWRLWAAAQCHTKESSGDVLMCLQSFLPSPLIWQFCLDTTLPPVSLWFLHTYILFPLWKQSGILDYFHLCDNKIVGQDLEEVWSLSVTDGHMYRGVRVCRGTQERTVKCWVGKSQKLELRQKSCCDYISVAHTRITQDAITTTTTWVNSKN